MDRKIKGWHLESRHVQYSSSGASHRPWLPRKATTSPPLMDTVRVNSHLEDPWLTDWGHLFFSLKVHIISQHLQGNMTANDAAELSIKVWQFPDSGSAHFISTPLPWVCRGAMMLSLASMWAKQSSNRRKRTTLGVIMVYQKHCSCWPTIDGSQSTVSGKHLIFSQVVSQALWEYSRYKLQRCLASLPVGTCRESLVSQGGSS